MNLPANWRTSLTAFIAACGGILTTFAALSYQLGDLATMIAPEWKPKLVIAGVMIERGAQILNGILQKDKAVSGNKVEGQTVAKADGTLKEIPPTTPAPPTN